MITYDNSNVRPDPDKDPLGHQLWLRKRAGQLGRPTSAMTGYQANGKPAKAPLPGKRVPDPKRDPAGHQVAQRDRFANLSAFAVPPVEAQSWCSGEGAEGHAQDVHDAIEANLKMVQRPNADVLAFVRAVVGALGRSGRTPEDLSEVADYAREVGRDQAAAFSDDGEW